MAQPGQAEARSTMSRLLNEARERKGLSIRAAARLADVPSATMQGWLNGRHTLTPALRGNFERLLDSLEVEVPAGYWSSDTPDADKPLPAPYLGQLPCSKACWTTGELVLPLTVETTSR